MRTDEGSVSLCSMPCFRARHAFFGKKEAHGWHGEPADGRIVVTCGSVMPSVGSECGITSFSILEKNTVEAGDGRDD